MDDDDGWDPFSWVFPYCAVILYALFVIALISKHIPQ